MIWAKTGKKEHVHGLAQHVKWLIGMESPVLMLGWIGAFLSVVRANNRFAIFAAQWGFGLLVAYSIVPYKTPWLALNFIIPLAIIGGYAVNEFYIWNKKELRFVVLVVVVAAAVSGYQSIKLNFFHYDDEDYAYVYGHTYRSFLPMVDEIKRIGKKTKLNEDLDIAVLSPDYWPLPWYLRDYNHIGYFGQPSATTSSVVIINESQVPTLAGRYRRIAAYPLRPGVVLVLYAREDLKLY
jgi:predicted membrane-bound mannosyltransferase